MQQFFDFDKVGMDYITAGSTLLNRHKHGAGAGAGGSSSSCGLVRRRNRELQRKGIHVHCVAGVG